MSERLRFPRTGRVYVGTCTQDERQIGSVTRSGNWWNALFRNERFGTFPTQRKAKEWMLGCWAEWKAETEK